MTEHLTEDEVIAAVSGLTRPRLVVFIETEVVIPLRRADGAVSVLVFRQIDVARMQVLCNLAEDLELDDSALAVVVALIDKLHAASQDLLAIARAVAAEPPDVRARIGAAIRTLRQGPQEGAF
jgi:chaperone modulatory protein CbpM